jgi:hypothetical protein
MSRGPLTLACWDDHTRGNRGTLEAFLAAPTSSGFTSHRLHPDELFVSETTEAYVI